MDNPTDEELLDMLRGHFKDDVPADVLDAARAVFGERPYDWASE